MVWSGGGSGLEGRSGDGRSVWRWEGLEVGLVWRRVWSGGGSGLEEGLFLEEGLVWRRSGLEEGLVWRRVWSGLEEGLVWRWEGPRGGSGLEEGLVWRWDLVWRRSGLEEGLVWKVGCWSWSWSVLLNRSLSPQNTQFPDQVRLSGLVAGVLLVPAHSDRLQRKLGQDRILVQVLSPEETSLFCLAPPKVGPCRASFTRNYNNYLSESACETACRNVTASLERNAPPPVAKVCGSQCVPGQLVCDSDCCVHKSLECDGVQQCSDGADESGCSNLNQTFNRLVTIKVDEKNARCTLPPHTGPCRASFSRWFYDPLEEKCQTFTFGGCDPNENNHEEETQCEEACRGVTDKDVYSPGMFKRYEDEDEGGSGSVALGVILAVTLLALLAIAAYCLIRKRKDSTHRPVSSSEI
ncbi:hypothetical protein WMY93_015339 [Mugilogobius chulae]|uniref:BPTI/Kunitz inhibitor domain-containing protein n=1 Tax=Mugilogobius chulae TaxID=88201 RepID=A0AAW0NSI5_9GOBI